MKKLIAILMALVIVAGFAFAADPTPTPINKTTANTITLESKIKEIIPAFKLYIGDDDDEATAPATYDTKKSIGDDEKIEATFWVKQEGEKLGTDPKDYSRYGAKNGGTAVKLTVTCGAFAYYGAEGTDNVDLTLVSARPSISGQAFVGTSKANELTFAASDITEPAEVAATETAPAGTAITFAPHYWGRKVTDRTIATFKATWARKDDLPLGVYKADVTLSYTTL